MSDGIPKILSPDELTALREQLAVQAEGTRRILVCSTGCLAVGAREVEAAFRQEVADAGLEDEVEVVQTGCHGLCAMAPVAVIEPERLLRGFATVSLTVGGIAVFIEPIYHRGGCP